MPKPSHAIIASHPTVEPGPEPPEFVITGFTAANHFATPAGGGEAGVATGFIEAILFRNDLWYPGADQTLIQRSNNTSQGHRIYSAASGIVLGGVGHPGGSIYWSGYWYMGRSSQSKLHLAVLQQDGASVRMWVNRVLAGGYSNAMPGYVPSANAHMIGYGQTNYPATAFSFLGALTARGQHTEAQIQELFRLVRARGRLPDADEWPFNITHRWSVRDIPSYEDYLDGDPAPPFIDCSVTIAAADRMSRVGSPVMRERDLLVPRKTYGAASLGYSGVNMLISAAGAGIRGSASGFAVRLIVYVYTVGSENYAACVGPNNAGWYIRRNTSTIIVSVHNGATQKTAQRVITNADQGMTHTVDLLFDGTNLYLVFDGVASAPTAAVGGFSPAAASANMSVGDNALGGSSACLFGLAGENGPITIAQLQQAARGFKKTGSIQPIEGTASGHLYDLTQDIVANGGADAGMPSQVLDRIGSDHLTRIGTPTISTFGTVRGIRCLTSAVFFGASGPGALAGAVTGFRAEWFGRLETSGTSIPLVTRILVQCGNVSSNVGWQACTINQNSSVRFSVYHGSGGYGATHTLTGADIGRNIHFVFLFDGTRIYIYKDGAVVANIAFTGTFAPYTLMDVGIACGDSVTHIGIAGHGSDASASAIAAAAAASLAAGKLVPIAGSTHHYDLSQDAIDAGDKLPIIAGNRGSAGGAAMLLGAPMLVVENFDHPWGYDSSPILHRAAEMSDTSKYIAGIGGTSGSHYNGLWFALLFLINTTQLATPLQHICGKRDSAFDNGWGFISTANLSQFAPRVSTTGSPNVLGPVFNMNSSQDVGKLLLIGGSLDPYYGVLRTFAKRMEYGSGTSLGGTFLPASSSPCALGSLITTLGSPAAGSNLAVRLFGMMCGQGVPGLARWGAAFDAAQAREDIVAIPGYTEHLWSITRSVKENGGTMPATIVDRIGTDHMTVYGSLAAEAHYARIWATA